MYYPLNETKSSILEDMSLNLCYMSTRCTEWAVLYSGMGIYNHISNKEMRRMFSHFKVKSDDKFLDVIHFIKCIYKKGRPDFLKPLKSSKRDKKYLWRFDTYDREIPLTSQSFAILSLCSCSRLIKYNEKRLSLTMLKAADSIFEFVVKNMKSGEGKFISFEDKTEDMKSILNLKRIDKHPNILDQVFLHEAFLTLNFETSNAKYKNYFKNNEEYIKESRKIFNYLFNNYDELIVLKSRDLSNAISSLSRCCSIEKDSDYVSSYRHLIATLSAELDSRVTDNGEVERSDNDSNNSSIITQFRTLSALLESFSETKIDRFKESSDRIFLNLNGYYDILSGMFVEKSVRKIRYTSREISEIIKALLLYYTYSEDEKSLEMLRGFYKSTIEDSSIISSTLERNPKFLSHEIKISDTIPLYEQTKKAPVILKGFDINTKKSPYPTNSKSFNSYYGLYSSYIFSFYFSPIIDYKKKLRGEITNKDNDFLEDLYHSILSQNEPRIDYELDVADENIGLNILD